jgi:hypothetical protein
VHDQQDYRRIRDYGGAARPAVYERHLSEEITGAQVRDNRAVPLDSGAAFHYEHELQPLRSLPSQYRVGIPLHLVGMARDHVKLAAAKRAEQRHLLQDVNLVRVTPQ